MSQVPEDAGDGGRGDRVDRTADDASDEQWEHQQPLPELLDTMKRKISLTTERSPRGYQKIDIPDADEDDNNGADHHSSRASSDSLSSVASESRRRHRFTCQFDPSVRNGRALVLKFDVNGVGTFQEMTRLALLRMTQDAARPNAPAVSDIMTPADDSAPEAQDERGHEARRMGFRTSSRRVLFRRQSLEPSAARAAAQHTTVCDVQRVHARDIRKLDNAFAVSNEAAFTVRKQAILVNADPLRAIIMRDACLVFVPDGADSLLSILKDKFLETTQHESTSSVAFEFKALEALLATLCRYFEADYEKNVPVISAVLDRLARGKVASSELETLRTFKNTMHEFESQVDGVRRALMEILDNEEDLRLLYLTKLYEDPELLNDLWSFDSEEAEVLIENYLQDIFSTRTKASLMQHRIQNTESLVMLKLDSMRNYLLGVDLVFSLTAISLSIGTFVTGAFGMNLNSKLEEAGGWFWGVVGFTLGIFVVLTGAGIQFFREKGILSWEDTAH